MSTDGFVDFLPAWMNVVAEIGKDRWTFGDLIPHAELFSLMGLHEPTGKITVEDVKKWQLAKLSNVEALKDYLLQNHNMLLACELGDGYRIVRPSDQTGFAMRCGMRDISRELRRTVGRLHFIDHSKLTGSERKENADAITRMASITGAITRIDRDAPADAPKTLTKPKHKKRAK